MRPTPRIIICNIITQTDKYGSRIYHTPCLTGTHIIIDNKESFHRIHILDMQTGTILKLSAQREYLEPKRSYLKVRNEETRPEVIKQIHQILWQAIS